MCYIIYHHNQLSSRNDHESEHEQDKNEENESEENTKSEATITELTAVREVVALKLLKLQTSTRGSGRGRGRGTVCRGHDLQNTLKEKCVKTQATIFLGKIFAVNLTEKKKTKQLSEQNE